eukprot:jgi/Chlat1/4331/Chrsp29S04485
MAAANTKLPYPPPQQQLGPSQAPARAGGVPNLQPQPSHQTVALSVLGGKHDQVLYDIKPAAIQRWWQCLLSILTLGLFWLLLWVARCHTRYVITSERVEVSMGSCVRRRKSYELHRIYEVELVEPCEMMCCGAGNIKMKLRGGHDSETELELRGVTQVSQVYEALRAVASRNS